MGSIYNRRMQSHVAPGLHVLAQEELLVEDLKVAAVGVERPLDAINRVRRRRTGFSSLACASRRPHVEEEVSG
ncbi:BZ3500_MvSof-1268-A1-R1_Chr7-1g09370 [Microbotryum saponariae]|uniref:BZ3500_MvSof-1268-A1-R1_Chr7-1g09370 protein n=1 Tax=Microbotryum saponariae TaxID=289078 RepID=A0A2X0L0W5_9BASI|nr:BZ3501_MvSof-1269-A2-R1_Chr7-1g09075 [Microbotryum saponariae]SDA03311.1 BZ3500_MvSof-1268-A1-R1_Chr7-1g09370 [Microbotryum saponariae]